VAIPRKKEQRLTRCGPAKGEAVAGPKANSYQLSASLWSHYMLISMVDPSDPYAETQAEREELRDKFARIYNASHPKAVETLSYDWHRMVAFYKFPKAHRSHLRTSNPIVSSFAALRQRTDAAKRFKKVSNATAVICKMLMVA